MPQGTCPSCQSLRNFSQRSPLVSGTPNGHNVALFQCDMCGFVVLAYMASHNSQILHYFPRHIRCMNCEVALRH